MSDPPARSQPPGEPESPGALRVGEQTYRALVEMSHDLIWSVDAQGRWTFVNAAARAIYGYEPAEMLGRPFMDFETPEQAEKDLEEFARIKAGTPAFNYETVHRRKDGTPVHLNFNAVFVRDAHGTVLGTTGTAQDITERKRAEAELRQSQARLVAAERVAHTGNWTYQVATGKIEWSDGMWPIYGRAPMPEELTYEVLLSMVHPDDRPRHDAYLAGLTALVPDSPPVPKFEYRLLRPDGSPRTVEVSCDPEFDEQGRPARFFGTVQDITERKQAEAALQESDRRLTTLIGNLPGYVYRVANDPDYTPEFISAGVERITGYSQREYLVDRTISGGVEIHPEDRAAVWSIVQRAVAAHEPYECEYRIRTKSGETKWVWERGSGAYAASGQVTALEGFVTDISARKLLEAQLRQVQKLEAVGQLAGGVAHDFNNILTVIQGHLSMLGASAGPPDTARESIAEIKQAADRAANLTRQLLTFSRRQAMRPGLLELNGVVTNMARMLQRILGEDIRMELRLAPQDLVVLADTGMIEQVLLNLAVNSRDAMPRGGRLLIETAAVDFDDTITARVPQARAGAFVCLTTTDTGTGIPPEILPRIFEPFFTTKEIGKGTGLGLATAYGIVQQHEGWIAVDSEPGCGTTFHVYLPRRPGAPAAPPPRDEPPATGGRETVLLVEDEPALRTLIGNLLGRVGYRVYAAATGPQALELWRAHASEINLLVTDLVMPDGLSGFDLGAQLTREAPRLRVIYTSGYSPEIAGRGEALVPGVNFLAKPFEVATLLRAIRAMLDQAQA